MKLFISVLFMVSLGCISCSTHKGYIISHTQAEYIPITTRNTSNISMNFLTSYKHSLDEEMNKIISISEQDMSTGRPESLLTNLTADLMLSLDTTYTDGQQIDIAFMNVHGIRAEINKGDVTVGDIFNAFPFDNGLYVLGLKGADLIEVFQSYAKMGGAGISANTRLVIKNGELISSELNGKAIDPNKTYVIVTLDYLAEGNDGMIALKKAIWKKDIGILLRDYMLNSISEMYNKGKKLSSTLDGRITIIE